MPTATRAEKKKLLHNFALDAVHCFTAEINQAYTTYAGDANKIKNKQSYATETVVHCYMGDHALCRKHSFACRGAINDNWLKKSTYIGHDFKFPHSRENEDLLRACVSMRLSPAILDKTIKNSNSQKVESFNRVLRRSLPCNVTFTCIFSGQAHSAAHSSNHSV